MNQFDNLHDRNLLLQETGFPQLITEGSEEADSALITQVGGDHYSKLAIQPVEYIHANGIGFCAGSAIKYLTRWKDKGGIQDLQKAKHFIDLLIEMESK